MDANGTRYQLLLGRDDWHWPPNAVTPAGFLAWDATRSELTLQPRLYHFAVPPGQRLPLDGRRGAGATGSATGTGSVPTATRS